MMDLYTSVSTQISRLIMKRYSTSFSASAIFFPVDIRTHIYTIYGLVRIADEIVDTYRGNDSLQLTTDLEQEIYDAMTRSYSSNPIIHAFAMTANQYAIQKAHISAFFESMRMDIEPQIYTDDRYKTYIYGSAEVIGLMCLSVFCKADAVTYTSLEDGARRLGAAYQKINFLRDLASDSRELGRLYFPGYTIETFDEVAKKQIIADITKDLIIADVSIERLPVGAKKATRLSRLYYGVLLKKLELAPLELLKTSRIRVSTFQKSILFGYVLLGGKP